MKAPTYLRVDATFKPDGVIIPTMIYWTDGTPYMSAPAPASNMAAPACGIW